MQTKYTNWHAELGPSRGVFFCLVLYTIVNDGLIIVSVSCRYSKGLGGLVGLVFGDDSIFNIPTSYIGVIYFPALLILSELSL